MVSMADVKVIGQLYTTLGEGTPTTSTTGILGDIYLDIDEDSATYGLSYKLTDITGAVYTWEAYIVEDCRISYFLYKAEQDYLRIRGIPFDTDDDDETIYPDGSDITGAEMVCYLMGIYEGRGLDSSSIGGVAKNFDEKMAGYPKSIVGAIKRYTYIL